MFSIGIDIGYSTLKCVVVDKEKKQVFKKCLFHHGSPNRILVEQLNVLRRKFSLADCYVGVIGEQRASLKKYNINDIASIVEGVLNMNGNVKSIIEIGAQSSRFISDFSNGNRANTKFYMNSSCSAGTGSFLEEQVSRLGIKIDDYSNCVKNAKNPPRIAGRCSVFAKTDMIHHQQEGVLTEDILLGLSYALVRNYKANVVQRNKVEKPVMFVGGVAHNEGVVQALKEVFCFSDDEVIVSDDCSIIGALGAAILGMEKNQLCSLEKLLEEIEDGDAIKLGKGLYKPLKEFGGGDGVNKHICKQPSEELIDVHVGIDIGSTSTNVVVIDSHNDVIAYRYLRTKGNPRKAADAGLQSIKAEFGGRLNIGSVGATGSGRNLVGKIHEADLIVNEITAQAKGAVELDCDVDTIFEIGGQDSKYISIEDSRVVDFEMNKICAAGTGSFIEEQAIKLDIPIEEYEQIALKGREPLELGSRCTVFIEGNISKAIAEGQSKENITAGLSYSIVNNYMNRVVGKKPIGKKIFLQGGIAHNQAVVNAFRAVLGKEIVVPPFFSVTGAYGAAILAKEEVQQKNKDKAVEGEIRNIEAEIDTMFLRGYSGEVDKSKLTVGIPRVLFLHKLFPMFNVYFKELGFNVVLSDETDNKIIEFSQEFSLDETCYPIKLINGHVATLIDKGVDYIFLPSLYTMKHLVSRTREDYACVYMQTVPQVISSVMDLESKGIKLLSPALSFKFGKKYMMRTLMDLGKQVGKNSVQTTVALAKGMQALKKYEAGVEKLGEEIIGNLKADEKVFVIVTRAYGVADKELNMGIPKRLREMGHKVLTLSNLPAHSYDLSEDYPNMYWPFGQHIISGAKIIKESKNLYAIYLTNHGCGPDAIISHYFKEEMQGKPYLHIEVDEHSSAVGVMTRLEAFIDSLKNDNKCIDVELNAAENKMNDNKIIEREEKLMYIPYLYPYSHLTQGLLKNRGFDVRVLQPTSEESLNIGKKFSVSKECVTLTALLGDVFSHIATRRDSERMKIWIPQTEGSESIGQYGSILEQKIKQAGVEGVSVNSPFVEDLLEDGDYGIDYAYVLIAGDVVMASDIENRDANLQVVLQHIKEGSLSGAELLNLARLVYKQNLSKMSNKFIYAVGEPSLLFNPTLNNNQLEKLEKNSNRVCYMPISEMMYFRWVDYFKKEEKLQKSLGEKLLLMKDLMNQVSNIMKEDSPFDNNLDKMLEIADSKLPLYSGGHGRYRMAKQFRCPSHVNGVLVLSSMYENTGTILKILKDQYQEELEYPLVELYFDGSKHSGNDERIKNFIYYI